MSSIRRQAAILFSRTGFRGPVLTLLTGTSASIGLSFLLLPVLTRLYTPADFGVLNYFVAVIGVLISVSSLHYDDAILIPEKDGEAAHVAALALCVTLLTALVCLIVLPWRREISEMLGMPEAAPWLVLIPPTLIVMRIAKVGEGWFVRSRRFRGITAGQVVNAAAMNTTRLLPSWPGIPATPAGLIGGFIAGQTSVAVFYSGFLLRQSRSRLRNALSFRRILSAGARYRRFAVFTTPSALLHALILRLPFLIIPVFFLDASTAILGYLGQAVNLLAVPLSLVGSAVAQVLFAHAAEAHRSGVLREMVTRVHARLVMIGLFPTAMLMAAGPELIGFVFGDTWREAGVYLRYLGPWLFLSATAAPLTRLFDILERQRTDLLTTASMFIILAAALVAGGSTGDIYRALLLLGAAGFFARLLHLGILLRLAGVSAPDALGAYLRYAPATALCVAMGYLGTLTGAAWHVLISTALAGLVYGSWMIWREQLLKLER